jgi:hypothetical protein
MDPNKNATRYPGGIFIRETQISEAERTEMCKSKELSKAIS